jgi:hypothetical protein
MATRCIGHARTIDMTHFGDICQRAIVPCDRPPCWPVPADLLPKNDAGEMQICAGIQSTDGSNAGPPFQYQKIAAVHLGQADIEANLLAFEYIKLRHRRRVSGGLVGATRPLMIEPTEGIGMVPGLDSDNRL